MMRPFQNVINYFITVAQNTHTNQQPYIQLIKVNTIRNLNVANVVYKKISAHLISNNFQTLSVSKKSFTDRIGFAIHDMHKIHIIRNFFVKQFYTSFEKHRAIKCG